MRGMETSVILSNGSRCLLRSPGPEDGEAVLRHLRRVAAESPYTAFLPEELAGTLREEQAFLKGQLASPTRLMLACFVEERLIGLGGIGPAAANRKCRHRAELGLSVRRRWWGLGAGTFLVEALCQEGAIWVTSGWNCQSWRTTSGQSRSTRPADLYVAACCPTHTVQRRTVRLPSL